MITTEIKVDERGSETHTETMSMLPWDTATSDYTWFVDPFADEPLRHAGETLCHHAHDVTPGELLLEARIHGLDVDRHVPLSEQRELAPYYLFLDLFDMA